MDNRRVAGQTGSLVLTVVVLLGLWGCPPGPAPDTETPPPPEPPKVEPVDDENQLILDEFDELERFASTGEVRIVISYSGSDNDEPSPCARKIRAQTFGPTIYWSPDYTPRKVSWRVGQRPNGTWMEGDRIFIERKRSGDDRCFSDEPFDIFYSDLEVESGLPLDACKVDDPYGALWVYRVTLFNEQECKSDGNPKGKVASWDPVVIIKPRK